MGKINAMVTIKGKIINVIPPKEDYPNYQFYVFDGSETIKVVINTELAKIISQSQELSPGKEVIFTGRVKARENLLETHIERSSDVVLQKYSISAPQPPQVSNTPVTDTSSGIISDLSLITNNLKDKEVTVFGKTASFKPAWNERAPNTITLTDGVKELPVVFWSDVDSKLSPEYKQIGVTLVIKGVVDEFRDAVQLKLINPQNIKLAGSTTASQAVQTEQKVVTQLAPAKPAQVIQPTSKVSIGSINQSSVTSKVIVEGAVTAFRESWSETAPNKVTISDGTGSIIIVYWRDIGALLPKVPAVGDKLQVTGEVQLYRNELQIKLANQNDIKFLSGGTGGTQPPQAQKIQQTPIQITPTQPLPQVTADKITPISQITASLDGKKVTVEGQISNFRAPRNERTPSAVDVKDNTGTISVVYWKEVSDKMTPEQSPVPGKNVRVKGTVNIYRNNVQLRLLNPADFQIIRK